MKMNRRNALLGLGAIATGGGALFGSGAFSQVDATRNVNFSVVNDSNALLGLSAVSSYASTETGDGAGKNIIRLDFGKLNDSATSTFEQVFEITNNTDDGNSKSITISNDQSLGAGVLDFQADGSGTYSGSVGDSLVSGITLSPGATVSVKAIFNTNNGDPSTINTITISAT